MPAAKKTKPAKATTTINKPTLVAFLLDRTGSMEDCKTETIKGFNSYVDNLRKEKENKDMLFTLTQFDSQSIDIIHAGVPLKDVENLTDTSYEPRGFTPLYDAIGKTVRATQTKAGVKYKVLFVTLTDGEENSSTEWTLKSVNALIKEMESKHAWTFAHIGVGITGWDAVKRYSVGTVSVGNILRTDQGDEEVMYARLAANTKSYARSTSNVEASASGFFTGTKAKK